MRWSISLSKFVAFILYVFSSLMILVSGFRGDVGSDTLVYALYYEQVHFGGVDFLLSDENRFDIFYGFLTYIFNYLEFSFESFLIVVAIFSLMSMSIAYLKSDARVYIVFVLLYLCFIYWQVQWSVIRQCMAFWIIVLSFLFLKRKYSLWFLSFLFHKSSLLILLSIVDGRAVKAIGIFLAGAALLYFYNRYSLLSSDIIISFFGDYGRWVQGGVIYLVLYAVAYRYWSFTGSVIISLCIGCALIIPIGWRVLAVFMPIILNSRNSNFIGFPFILHGWILFFLFVIKSYNHYVNMVTSGFEPELIFILNFLGFSF